MPCNSMNSILNNHNKREVSGKTRKIQIKSVF